MVWSSRAPCLTLLPAAKRRGNNGLNARSRSARWPTGTVVMGSGEPFSPSTTAIRMSSDPTVAQLVHDLEPEFGSFVLFDPMPSTSLVPSAAMHGQIYRFVPRPSLVADLHPQRVEIDPRIASFQRPILPRDHRFPHRIGRCADDRHPRAYIAMIFSSKP